MAGGQHSGSSETEQYQSPLTLGQNRSDAPTSYDILERHEPCHAARLEQNGAMPHC